MFFFENYNFQTVLVLVVMLVLLILLNEITRRNKWMALGMYIVLPILLSIFLWPKSAGAGTSGGYWFAWVKTYSALAGFLLLIKGLIINLDKVGYIPNRRLD